MDFMKLVVKFIRLVPACKQSGTTAMGWFRDRQVSDRECGNWTFALWRKLGRVRTASFRAEIAESDHSFIARRDNSRILRS